MRKIALLAVVAFAAACGGSSSTPGTGYLRVANLSPDASNLAIDFCVRASGTTTWSNPVMAAAGYNTGVVYGGTGSTAGALQMTKYFPYDAGSYDVAVYAKGLAGAGCANPVATLTNVSLADAGYRTIALVGINATPPAVQRKLVAFTDTVSPAAGKAAVRVVNAGILALPGADPAALPAFDLGITTASTGYVKVFGNVAYPGIAATGVDAGG